MLYSSAGALALIIHLIINHDVLRKNGDKERVPAYSSFRAFLLVVMVYYISDICWGILYERQLITLTFIDTAVYFVAMAGSILLWTRYVVDYLKEDNLFGGILKNIGWLIFGFELIVVVINFFIPVLFYFDAEGVYHAAFARYITLAVQIDMFVMTAVYAMGVAIKSQGTMKFRHLTIGLFSLAMTGFALAQVYFPLLPLYAIGCLLGGCVLHSFVLENEKEEYRDELEERLKENILKGNYYDLLTGLPGMTYFFELAENKRTRMIAEGGEPAFLFMDLSGMKFFNQKYGFAEGDRLLQTFARLLVTEFGEDNCSRFGQDHFVVFTDEKSPEPGNGETSESDMRVSGLEDKLKRMLRLWEESGQRDRHKDLPAIRVGVYLDRISGPAGNRPDISAACDCAKAARDSIRNTYVSGIRYYDNSMLESAEKKQYIISHLDKAIEEKWIQVYYHPIIRAINGRVCDEEALARWDDPDRGFLSPADFIPVLEEVNLIYKLDLYVVEQVIEKTHRLKSSGLFLVPQSVNLSRSDFDSCDMVEEIRRRVDEAGIPRRLLNIEITESIVGSDFDFIKEQIDRFRSLGFQVWMDDFGSGYSSLDVLANMQVDLVKFDMRFMQEFDHGDKSRIVLTELMRMVMALGIDTVCEGVERKDQEVFLRNIGCARLQGFYYTRPMPAKQILERYEKGNQIGFENPAESAYYNTIGRVNLYDLDVFAREDEDSFRNYFSTLPMAIIEVKDNSFRFTRTNQAYRDFMKQTFRLSLAEFGEYFEKADHGGQLFIDMLEQCCKEGGRAVFDEKLPDGTTVHSFMRRIATNELTGTAAAAVAVLAIT